MLRVKRSPWPRGAYASAVGQALRLFCKRSFNYGDLIWENNAHVCGLRGGLFGAMQLSPALTHAPALSQLQAEGATHTNAPGLKEEWPAWKTERTSSRLLWVRGGGVSWDAARSCVQMVLNLRFWGWAGVSQVKARKAEATAAGKAQSPARGNGHKQGSWGLPVLGSRVSGFTPGAGWLGACFWEQRTQHSIFMEKTTRARAKGPESQDCPEPVLGPWPSLISTCSFTLSSCKTRRWYQAHL